MRLTLQEKRRSKQDAAEVRRQASKEVAAAQAAADERVEEYSETLRSQVCCFADHSFDNQLMDGL